MGKGRTASNTVALSDWRAEGLCNLVDQAHRNLADVQGRKISVVGKATPGTRLRVDQISGRKRGGSQ